LRAEDLPDWTSEPWRARLKPVQDTLFWSAFGLAGELGLPVQVHSGLEFMQPWDGRPSALIPSLIRFPETRFVLFHGSYPHMAELTGLAKSFSNVYLDLAWFHLVSRHQARMWLAEWLDVLPHNKIMAFGGDAFLFFGVCSHLELARDNVAAVLAARVAEGFCDLDEAEHTARLLFHDNARQVFRWA
jgi:predicted TIM-barrel fold metal-dependent hydrolase